MKLTKKTQSERAPNVIILKKPIGNYGKKKKEIITSQGTPDPNRDPILTMSAHDKAEIFIEQMRLSRLEQIRKDSYTKPKVKSKIESIKKKVRGGKKKNDKKRRK